MTQRDWQKDMEMCKQLNEWYEHDWEAGQEEGSRIIRIYETVPDEPFNFVAECENDLTTTFIMESRAALPYWLQEAKELQEIVSGRGREILRLRNLLVGLNDELTATEARADAAESREQEIKRAIGRCLVAGNSLGSIIMNYNLPEGHEEWSFQEANSYFFGKFYNDRRSAYESYETWIAWKAIMGASEIMSTLYPDTPAPKEDE